MWVYCLMETFDRFNYNRMEGFIVGVFTSMEAAQQEKERREATPEHTGQRYWVATRLVEEG